MTAVMTGGLTTRLCAIHNPCALGTSQDRRRALKAAARPSITAVATDHVIECCAANGSAVASLAAAFDMRRRLVWHAPCPAFVIPDLLHDGPRRQFVARVVQPLRRHFSAPSGNRWQSIGSTGRPD